MTYALEMWVLVMSSRWVVWEDALDIARAMILDGCRAVDFRLSHLSSFEYRILLFNQEVQAFRRPVFRRVGRLRTPERPMRMMIQADIARVARMIERI